MPFVNILRVSLLDRWICIPLRTNTQQPYPNSQLNDGDDDDLIGDVTDAVHQQ